MNRETTGLNYNSKFDFISNKKINLNKMMEITDLRIEKFNKVADLSSLSSSEVLSQLTVV